MARTRTEWLEAVRKTAQALREKASISREMAVLARRRASCLHALAQARGRESDVCSEQSVGAMRRYSELAEKEGIISEQEAATFEAEASRAEAEAESAERRAAGSFGAFTEGKRS